MFIIQSHLNPYTIHIDNISARQVYPPGPNDVIQDTAEMTRLQAQIRKLQDDCNNRGRKNQKLQDEIAELKSTSENRHHKIIQKYNKANELIKQRDARIANLLYLIKIALPPERSLTPYEAEKEKNDKQ